MAILTTFITAVVARIAADEAKASLPNLSKKLLALAVHRLPCDQRERFREEWAADLESYPGEVTRLLRALGMVWAAWMIGAAILEKMRSDAATVWEIGSKYAWSVLGLTILGGTLAAIWAKFQPRHTVNVRIITLYGFCAGLIIALALVGLIVRNEMQSRKTQKLEFDR